jgi:hypothetical protein
MPMAHMPPTLLGTLSGRMSTRWPLPRRLVMLVAKVDLWW